MESEKRDGAVETVNKTVNKTSQRRPIHPTVADNRTRNLLILRAPVVDFPPVTAEVASSSLVVPAILSITYGE